LGSWVNVKKPNLCLPVHKSKN